MKGKILIVDDEIKILKLLERLLSKEGYETIRALDGFQAMEILEKQNVDMILSDITMPKMSGLEVLEKIRKNEKLQTLPVIIITGLNDTEDRIKGIKLGADDYVSKPFDLAELISKVNTQIKLSFLRRQIAEKEKLTKIIEIMAEGVIITDRNYCPLIVNNKARELLDIKELPQNIFKYINENFHTDISAKKEINSFVINRPETKLHNPLYLSIIIQQVKNPAGEIDSHVFILRNITKEYLENRLKQDFFSLISHKLRTPLTVIIGIAGILVPKNEEEKSLLEIMANSSTDMKNLVSRLLYFIDVIEEENMNEKVTAEVIDYMVAGLKKKYNKSVLMRTKITVGKIFFWEKIVIEELLDNAVKFCKEEESEIKLNINVNLIEISDNGPGIPPEEKDKVFEPFYQIDKYFTGNISGVGLGLTLVKRLVEFHGWKIDFESHIGKGTEFRIIKGDKQDDTEKNLINR